VISPNKQSQNANLSRVFTHFHSVKNANTQLIWSSVIIGEKNTDLKRLKLRFLTEIG
jgi:hypothetical protein